MTTAKKPRVYRHDPRPLKTGACPSCFRVIAVNPSGLRRQHRDDNRVVCLGSGVRVVPERVPAEVLSAARIVIPKGRPEQRRPSPTGRCHECDRRITGERLYCGPCAAGRRQ